MQPQNVTNPVEQPKSLPKSSTAFIKQHFGFFLITFIPFFLIGGLAGIGLLLAHAYLASLIGFAVPALVIAVWILCGRVVGGDSNESLGAYLQARGFGFGSEPFKPEPGPLLHLGHDHHADTYITGNIRDSTFNLYDDKFTFVNGKYQEAQGSCNVIQVVLSVQGPHMYLANRANYIMDKENLQDCFQHPQSYQLEGEFNQHYTLYGEAGNQNNLLELINPAAMEIILTVGRWTFDIELNGNILRLYNPFFTISDTGNVEKTIQALQSLVDSFEPTLQRMNIATPLSAHV